MASCLLRSLRRSSWKKMVISPARTISLSATRKLLEIEEKVEGKVITVSGQQSASDRAHRLVCGPNDNKACPLCRLGVKVTFSDVLILEQFMRSDGTVLPQDATGLCGEQQTIVERSVQQAHWSGLFPNNKPKGYNAATEEAEYRKYKRYWAKHEDMFERKVDLRPGSWYYVRRY